MTLARMYQDVYARSLGYSDEQLQEMTAKAEILDLYSEVLATAGYAGIGDAVLDDLWNEARERSSSHREFPHDAA